MPPPGLEKMRLGPFKNGGFVGAGPERKPENMEKSWDLNGFDRDFTGFDRDFIGFHGVYLVGIFVRCSWDFFH